MTGQSTMGAFRHSDSKQETLSADREDDPRTPKYPRRKRYGWRVFWVVVVLAGVALGVACVGGSLTPMCPRPVLRRCSAG
ncbi:hypothetical protein GIW23_14635, partial [Pseudomonas syringae]|uniref:hypothetical protein n=1 Tax=Pseudomonas syringae TaxID=317 RepID=UPI001F9DC796|nr:hypothetical protein [Pseudomonas syringae]